MGPDFQFKFITKNHLKKVVWEAEEEMENCLTPALSQKIFLNSFYKYYLNKLKRNIWTTYVFPVYFETNKQIFALGNWLCLHIIKFSILACGKFPLYVRLCLHLSPSNSVTYISIFAYTRTYYLQLFTVNIGVKDNTSLRNVHCNTRCTQSRQLYDYYPISNFIILSVGTRWRNNI